MQHRTILSLASAMLLSSSFVHAEEIDRSQQAADVSSQFMQTLGKTMKSTLKAEGPVAAIQVCSEAAPKIAGDLSRQHGWQVSRVSTRVRNPMLGTADQWQQQILADFERRLSNGEAAESLRHSEIVSEPSGRYFRYMQAITVGQACLTCHGSAENIPAPVKTILSEHYPHDQAVGYQEGDLRGAVSIKYPISE